MSIERIIIIGAGCPLSNAIANKLSNNTEVIGIAKREFENECYSKKIIFDFMSETLCQKKLYELTNDVESFCIITCTGRFPQRKFLAEYSLEDDLEIYKSNISGFVIPYRATILNARKAKIAAYITFGSVSQICNYPKLSIFTATKDALRSLILTASHEESGHNVRFFHFNLSTLDQEKEACFTSNSAGEFLPCEDVAENVENALKGLSSSPYFSEFFLYKHSDAYYKDGYYSRIPDPPYVK